MRLRFVAFLLFAAALGLHAASNTNLNATFLPNLSATGAGVSEEGSAFYAAGFEGVRCYFGVKGKNLVLVTYNTPRKLHFKFDPSSVAWQRSGLPAEFAAEVDFYGVNFYGPYVSMGDGTTAQVQASLQFHYAGNTYELAYPALAAYRTGNTWLITSNRYDIPGYPGFWASDQASINLLRRNRKTNMGAVNMPVRFQVTPQ